MKQRAERLVANHRRQPRTNAKPNREAAEKVENLMRADEPRKRSVQAPRRKHPEGPAMMPTVSTAAAPHKPERGWATEKGRSPA
jgi:hypothetical protein